MKLYTIPEQKVGNFQKRFEENAENKFRFKQTIAQIELQSQSKIYCPARSSVKTILQRLNTKSEN